MTRTEERVRAALREMAAESQPVPLLPRLMSRRPAVERRRRRIIIASAAAGAAVAVVGGLLLASYVPTKAAQPAQPVVKNLHLSHRSSTHPGSARMFVTVTRGASAGFTPYVLPAAPGEAAVRLEPKDGVEQVVEQQQLSADGRFLLQLHGVYLSRPEPTVVLTDLATGAQHRFANPQSSWAGLSPDDKTLALRDRTRLILVDVATGASKALPQLKLGADPGCASDLGGSTCGVQLGWSPDGRLLAVEDVKNTLIVDLGGHVHARLPGVSLANASMSWSPDGRSLLVYDGAHAGLRVVPATGGPGLALNPPADAVRALGWTGNRVVWLAGEPGAQRLITTDMNGGAVATWMRFHVGGQSVGSVSWSLAMGR